MGVAGGARLGQARQGVARRGRAGREAVMKTGKIINAMPITRAALIYNAQKGDREAWKTVSIDEADQFRPAGSFERFLEVNKIVTFERVLR